jgi:predicted kinase
VEAVIFSGAQCSGKSTFFRERFFDTHVRINLDMLKTRHRETVLLEACLTAGQPFVVDKTNPTVEERARYIGAARAAEFRVVCYFFSVGTQEALARNEARDPPKRVTISGLMDTVKRMTIPSRNEDFDELYVVGPNSKGGFVVQEMPDQLELNIP